MLVTPPTPTPLPLLFLLSYALLLAISSAAIGRGEQSDSRHGFFPLGCSDFGWKKSYADGENAIGLALAIPWGALSWALTIERRKREEKRLREIMDFIFFCFWDTWKVRKELALWEYEWVQDALHWVFIRYLGSSCCLEFNSGDEKEGKRAGTKWWECGFCSMSIDKKKEKRKKAVSQSALINVNQGPEAISTLWACWQDMLLGMFRIDNLW